MNSSAPPRGSVIAKQPALPRVERAPTEARSYVRFEGFRGHCLSDLHYDHFGNLEHFPKPVHVSTTSMDSGPGIRRTSRCAPTVEGGVSGQARRMRRRADCRSSTVTRLSSIMRLGAIRSERIRSSSTLLQRPSCSLLTRFTISRNGGGYADRGGGGSAGHVRGVRHPQ